MSEIMKRSIKIGLAGLAFGCMFPIMSWVVLMFEYDLPFSFSSIQTMHQKNILLWIIDVAPLVLGSLSFYLGNLVTNNSFKLEHIIDEQRESHNNFVTFAESIGKGDFKYQYEVKDQSDKLGLALVQMNADLLENVEKERASNWLAIGRERISSILNQNKGLDVIVMSLLTEIISYTDTLQGAFFLAENDDPKLSIKERRKRTTLEMYAHYAYGRKKYTKSTYKLGEGLIGESAIEQNIIHRTEIPDDFLTVTSGLIKDEKPKALLIVPIVSEDELQGVLEISSFKKFTDTQIQFLEEVALIIARALYNIKTNSNTSRLLIESQEMTNELQEQQEQLQMNALDMQAHQEQIEKTNIKLERQVIEINNAQKRQNSLLLNASEVIAIYDETGTITYESPSITKILGYTPDEMVGTNIFDSKTPSSTLMKLRDLFSFSKENPDENKLIEIPYTKKNGEKVTLEALATNLIKDEAVKGIVINFRDITERLLAEKETAMRAKMQALSENSKDIILRFDLNKIFQYANPTLQKYVGLEADFVNGKCIDDIEFNESFSKCIKETIDKVNELQTLVISEVTFESIEGDKTMHVNAIPEFDDSDKLDSVLIVAHDITERKKQANVLAKTNKQIKDSINYARRIQDAIIPNLDDIRADLGDVIQYYNPKDVVSGDFPYYYKKGRYAYYAAVDCTGHGVPGAMMSLIGHLILNDILNNDEIYTPAEVLTKLHWGVVRTLKQDRPENKAADGMDVALCRIDLESDELLYSGAHRPLYHVVGEEIVQYKGDKYPIGGSQYKGLNSFSNHEIYIKKGESVYFFSDGYPDQFGGPNDLKYGPKRIRKGIVANKDKSVEEITDYFANSFEEWRENTKQIDDVLLIGIKF